jgi:propanol-preferring alcohol dehydrogenase
MKAVRLTKIGQPLEEQDIPLPQIGANDVLVQVKAAGICHSDAHYRAGVSPVNPLPLTLGHEVAGVIDQVGANVQSLKPGDRVCLHYLVTCGDCEFCHQGSEQFCTTCSMIGKYQDGGYAEYIGIPARSVFRLPEEIPFREGAIMMCSAATSFHALRKVHLRSGESVAIYGVGGLGISAVQLAGALGALDIFAIDINPQKLELAEAYGAIPINAEKTDPVAAIKSYNQGKGVDVALELIGLSKTMEQAIQSVGVFGRVGLVGLSDNMISIDPYKQLLMREAEIIGVADHLASEIPKLIEFVRRGKLDLSQVITKTIPLTAGQINTTLDHMDTYAHEGRVVITPGA